METYKIDLNPLQTQHKLSPHYYSIMGIIYIVLGIINYIVHHYSFVNGLIWVLGGIIFLIGGYYQRNYSSKYFILLNEKYVQIKDSMKETKTISWKSITNISIKPISIEFHLNDNKTENLSLGDLGYRNVLEFKDKLREFSKINGIELD